MLIQDQLNGFLYEPGDTGSLENAILLVESKTPEELNMISGRAKKSFQDEYNSPSGQVITSLSSHLNIMRQVYSARR